MILQVWKQYNVEQVTLTAQIVDVRAQFLEIQNQSGSGTWDSISMWKWIWVWGRGRGWAESEIAIKFEEEEIYEVEVEVELNLRLQSNLKKREFCSMCVQVICWEGRSSTWIGSFTAGFTREWGRDIHFWRPDSQPPDWRGRHCYCKKSIRGDCFFLQMRLIFTGQHF